MYLHLAERNQNSSLYLTERKLILFPAIQQKRRPFLFSSICTHSIVNTLSFNFFSTFFFPLLLQIRCHASATPTAPSRSLLTHIPWVPCRPWALASAPQLSPVCCSVLQCVAVCCSVLQLLNCHLSIHTHRHNHRHRHTYTHSNTPTPTSTPILTPKRIAREQEKEQGERKRERKQERESHVLGGERFRESERSTASTRVRNREWKTERERERGRER